MNIYAQTNDYSAVPQQLKDQVNERYPGARRAVLRTGGDFPFLSRPDEVTLYLQVLSIIFCFLLIVKAGLLRTNWKTLAATHEASWSGTKARFGPGFHTWW